MEIKIIETSDMHGYVLPTNYTERKYGLRIQYGEGCDCDSSLKEEANGPVIQIENGDFVKGHH